MGLKQELNREFEGFPRPDLWAEIESRATRPGPTELPAPDGGPGGLPRKRLVAAVVAFVVFLGALAILWSAFRAAPPRPAEPRPSPTGVGRSAPERRAHRVRGDGRILRGRPRRPGSGDGSAPSLRGHFSRHRLRLRSRRLAAPLSAARPGRRTAGGWRSKCPALGAIRESCRAPRRALGRRRGRWASARGRSLRLVPSGERRPHVWAWGPAGRGVAYASSTWPRERVARMRQRALRLRSVRRDATVVGTGRRSDHRVVSDPGREPDRARGRRRSLPGRPGERRVVADRHVSRGRQRRLGGGWPGGIESLPDGTKLALDAPSAGARRGRWGARVLDAEGSELLRPPAPGGRPVPGCPEVSVCPRTAPRSRTPPLSTTVKEPGSGGGIAGRSGRSRLTARTRRWSSIQAAASRSRSDPRGRPTAPGWPSRRDEGRASDAVARRRHGRRHRRAAAHRRADGPELAWRVVLVGGGWTPGHLG